MTKNTKNRATKVQMDIRYFTKALLVRCAKMATKWDYNRQLSMKVRQLPDMHFPVLVSMVHNHRNFVECEEHMRCMVGLAPGGAALIVDMPVEFFNALPSIRRMVSPEMAKALGQIIAA
jgi:hypothetical protein